MSRLPSPANLLSLPLIALAMGLLGSPALAQKTVVQVSGQVYDGQLGPFTKDKIYWVVSGGIQVPTGKKLTILPGTIVKFKGNSMNVTGTLDAKDVLFTSDIDDTGGDTNKDGSRTTPKAGDWSEIVFHAGSEQSVLDGCTVHYAGRSHTNPIWIRSAKTVTINNTTIDQFIGIGINFGWSSPKITNCKITRGIGYPMGGMAIGTKQFKGNTASGNSLGDYLRIRHHNNSWNNGRDLYWTKPLPN